MEIAIVINGETTQILKDVYEVMKKEFKLPDYFSYNLNSLEECLNDLSWFPQNPNFKLTIYNHESFLKKEPLMRKEVMDILNNIDLNYPKNDKNQKFTLLLK